MKIKIEKKRIPIKFFWWKEGVSKAANKKYANEATENGDRDSTLNKSTNSLLTSECL